MQVSSHASNVCNHQRENINYERQVEKNQVEKNHF